MLGCRAIGLQVCWFIALLAVRLLGAGLLGCFVVGLLGRSDVGLLGCCLSGLLCCWVVGLLGCRLEASKQAKEA